jgi:hypothetical protein
LPSPNIGRHLTSDQIERAVRIAIPYGATLPFVESYFRKNRIVYGFDRFTSTLYATIRRVRGSFIASKDVEIRCHFTDRKTVDKITFSVSNTFL